MVLSLRGFGDTILKWYLVKSAFRRTCYNYVSLSTPVRVVNLFPIPYEGVIGYSGPRDANDTSG
jgi:hypothetical protein